MRSILFLSFFGIIMGTSCKLTQKLLHKRTVPHAIKSGHQGISGKVILVTRNQLPKIDRTPNDPQQFPTTIFFHEPTNISQVVQANRSPLFSTIFTKLVGYVETDSTGSFKKALPVGTYSVFVQVGRYFFANDFDIRNNIALVTVEPGKMTDIKIIVNNEATY